MEELKKNLTELFQLANLSIQDFKLELESQEYAACRFSLGKQKILYRKAKITPKKVGQFVVLWKRAADGVIAPFDVEDEIDFFVIEVSSLKRSGQFVFTRSNLYKKKILKGNRSEGKRAIRVYPAWDVPTSRQAKMTQAWQLESFFELSKNQEENASNIKKKYLSGLCSRL